MPHHNQVNNEELLNVLTKMPYAYGGVEVCYGSHCGSRYGPSMVYAVALTLYPHLGVQGDHPQKPEEPTTLDKKCGLSNRLRATVFAMVDAQQQYQADVR